MIRLDTTDTIVALSSGSGPALRSIVRLSGPRAWEMIVGLSSLPAGEKPDRPFAFVSEFRFADYDGALHGRLQYWPCGRSYTGQELIECHLDTPDLMAEIVMRQCVIAGARGAEPGEFTMRAFLEGRMDLTRAEAVAGLFQASTPAQMEVALEQLAGGLGRRMDRLRNRLLDLLAWLEATLDFVEEIDVDPVARNFVAEELRGSAWELARLADQWEHRDTPATSPRVLLVGRPNAGKSRLFNAIAHSARALVSPVAGTTRDYLEETIILSDGRHVTLVDTAGMGITEDAFDTHAQEFGRRERLLADLLLVCLPCDESSDTCEELIGDFPGGVARLIVRTKADLEKPSDAEGRDDHADLPWVSALTGRGLDDLRRAIATKLDSMAAEGGQVVSGTRTRAREALRDAIDSLQRAAETVDTDGGDDLVAMDLRAAVESLDVIAGRDATEETLDRVFSRFCIGK